MTSRARSAPQRLQAHVERLDLYELKWYNKAKHGKILHKKSNTQLALHGFLEFSPKSFNHARQLLVDLKPTRMVGCYDKDRLKDLLEMLSLDKNPNLLNNVNSDAGIRTLYQEVIKKFNAQIVANNNIIPLEMAKMYFPTRTFGIPPCADVLLWLNYTHKASLDPSTFLNVYADKDYLEEAKNSALGWFGYKRDQMFEGIFQRKMRAKNLIFDASIRSRMPYFRSDKGNNATDILIQHPDKKGYVKMDDLMSFLQEKMMVLTPEEVANVLVLLRAWLKFHYKNTVHKQAEHAASMVKNELDNKMKSGSKKEEVWLVSMHRTQLLAMESIFLKQEDDFEVIHKQ
ncbi:hypothetical protein MP638_005401 [Amoeboaphelidium occidentale]|nr:hypothetical protein MP638_005401 [Amoeboaphelidium occidentale]